MKPYLTDVFVVIFIQANNNFDFSIPKHPLVQVYHLENCQFKKKENFYLYLQPRSDITLLTTEADTPALVSMLLIVLHTFDGAVVGCVVAVGA
ncbi:MAG: hypothetical protein ACREAN_05550, partial [Nitrosopumilaceae archaeon]